MFYQHSHIGTAEYLVSERGKNFSFPTHMHQCFEFISIVSGEMVVKIDNTSYTLKAGDGVLVFPNQVHSLSSVECEHYLLIFSPRLVSAFFSKNSQKKPADNRFCPDKFILDGVDSLQTDSSLIRKKGILYLLCDAFDRNAVYVTDENKTLLERIFAFIDQQYCGSCTLSDLSKSIGYNASYLSRFFKNSVGISFNRYVNIYRLNQACYLMENTQESVFTCAMECGYESIRTFNRNFKEHFGISPKQYLQNVNAQVS